ncbi:hypothetical protein C0Q93_30415 [Streptomyces albidoflavus]|nr:hypothetical protein C0Q93_30415 [Streptomyces albidoflavus]
MHPFRLTAVVGAVGVAAALLTGCSQQSPAEAGEEYGSTIEHSDPDLTCLSEGIHRYDQEKAEDAFIEACKERAKR